MAKIVLIVDDSQIALDVGRFTLTAAGYQVLTATGGLEALEIMDGNAVDLILLDINMPGMDGYTLIQKIRADRVFGEVPIAIITTEAEARDRQKGFDVGANAYLIKPVKPEAMIAQVRLLIGEA